MGRDALDHVAQIDDRIDLQATLAKWQSSLQCENYFISIPCASHERGLRDGLLEYAASATKPNILVIMGDDIGYWNISADNRGMMGYRTPNIDRIANEGAIFTDYQGQQSCTAGRAALITGQSPMRTGLLKVGLPGAKEGLSEKDPTLAELLKPLGYITGQFGKNHLGDRNEFLPTVHGFDEFFGNLDHLNAEDEPEHCDNCQARFVAWYGTEEDSDTETVDVEKCGLCGGDSFKKDVFRDTVIRLIAQVTARNVKRD